MVKRIITAIIALLIFIPITVYGGLPFFMLTFVMGTIGMFELLRAINGIKFLIPSVISLFATWLILLSAQDYIFTFLKLDFKITFIGLMVLLLTYTVCSENKFSFEQAGTFILGTMYVAIGFYFFIYMREVGLSYLLFTLFVIWATDSGAYFSGNLFGSKKLWPSISPNKTVEGAIGGLIIAIITGIIFQIVAPFDMPFILLLGYTILISIAGQMGDLVASALKRHFAVDDFGQLLPGHGGIIDRFDSLLFVLPILYVLNFI